MYIRGFIGTFDSETTVLFSVQFQKIVVRKRQSFEHRISFFSGFLRLYFQSPQLEAECQTNVYSWLTESVLQKCTLAFEQFIEVNVIVKFCTTSFPLIAWLIRSVSNFFSKHYVTCQLETLFTQSSSTPLIQADLASLRVAYQDVQQATKSFHNCLFEPDWGFVGRQCR